MNVKPWSTVGAGTNLPVVKGIQYLLRARGHVVAADGIYGPATAAAVTAFQSGARSHRGRRRRPADVAGARRRDARRLIRRCRTRVQQFGLVPSPGLPELVVDGSYGPITAERVRFFQESWGLTTSTVRPGAETWFFLSTFVPGPRPWPLVKQGATQATNWRVLAAQQLLRAHGSAIVADGAFGRPAVRRCRRSSMDCGRPRSARRSDSSTGRT